MKIKILSLGILILLIGGAFIGNGKISEIGSNNGLETIEVNIALLSQERHWWARDLLFFKEMLFDYEWTVGNKHYKFVVDLIIDEDILKGELNVENYDVIVVAGGAIGDGECFTRWKPTLENYRWKKNMADFIKDGGGYYSVCGGTTLITDLAYEPKSFIEMSYEKSSFGVSCVKSYWKSFANPLFAEILLPPESVGELAYCLYTGWNLSDFDASHRGGNCQDFQINTSHPIFDDFNGDTRRLRWIGGPALIVPDLPDRELSVLAKYPKLEISDNESVRMNVWDYTGGIKGMIKGIIKSFKDKENLEFANPLVGAYTHAEDWKCTDKVMETDLGDRAAMTAEIYPNQNEGRMVLCGPHAERNVWWGGHYEQVKDHDHNTLFEGFYKWVNITPNPLEYEWTYNFCVNRRCIAWAAKVPDEDLPPVYGPSQVCDFEDDVDSEVFTVMGNSEIAEGIASLDLYYRYSVDDIEYGNWTIFGTDSDELDGWSWEFNSPNDPGHYQFYSIRHVEYQGHEEVEKVPPGPDAIVQVMEV